MIKKTIRTLGVGAVFVFMLALLGCGLSPKVSIDYADAESFEAALNNGENLEGKVVQFVAGELHPDSALGYDVWAGQHLNFISSRNPDINTGDTVVVRATTIESMLGSWIIKYEMVSNAEITNTTISSEISPDTAGLNGADVASLETSEAKTETKVLDTVADNDVLENATDQTVGSEKTEQANTDMTPEELEAKLDEQEMIVFDTVYNVQTSEEAYKAIYPDMLTVVIKNNSGKDVKNAIVALAAWDANGFPVKIKGQFDYTDGEYEKLVDCGDVNLVDGDKWGDDKGFGLDSTCDDISDFRAIVVSYTDFDGHTWNNPLYETWENTYVNKKLQK